MNTSEATAMIVKAILDNKMMFFLDPESYTDETLAKINNFNTEQLCSLIKSVKAELEKRDGDHATCSFN